MTEQIDDAAELQRAEQPKQQPDLKTEHRDDGEVLIGIGSRMFTDRSRNHQRGNGDRANHKLPGRSQQGVDHHRRQTGVQTRLGRQAGQKGVRDRLRNGDDAEHEPGHAIMRQVLPPVRACDRHDGYVPGHDVQKMSAVFLHAKSRGSARVRLPRADRAL